MLAQCRELFNPAAAASVLKWHRKPTAVAKGRTRSPSPPGALRVYLWISIPFLSMKQKRWKGGVLNTNSRAKRMTMTLDKGQFSHFSHHFWHLPWTLILSVEHPHYQCSQMLTTLLSILTNKNEIKQHTECTQQFYVAPNSSKLTSHLQCNDLQFHSPLAAK